MKKEIGNDFTAAQSLTKGHHPADVHRTHQRGGCSYSDHHAGNDFRRRHPERGRNGRRAKGSVGQVRSGVDGISPIHLRPRAGEAKCRPGAMSGCAELAQAGDTAARDYSAGKQSGIHPKNSAGAIPGAWGWMKMILELI